MIFNSLTCCKLLARFQNRFEIMLTLEKSVSPESFKEKDWIFIVLNIEKNIRLERLQQLYPNNYEDHIKNMNHLSETCNLSLPEDTIYIDMSEPYEKINQTIFAFLEKNKFKPFIANQTTSAKSLLS